MTTENIYIVNGVVLDGSYNYYYFITILFIILKVPIQKATARARICM